MTRAKPDRDQNWCSGWALAKGQCEHWDVKSIQEGYTSWVDPEHTGCLVAQPYADLLGTQEKAITIR